MMIDKSKSVRKEVEIEKINDLLYQLHLTDQMITQLFEKQLRWLTAIKCRGFCGSLLEVANRPGLDPSFLGILESERGYVGHQA